jgi:hypothetical protein
VQIRELVQLVDHGRGRGRRRRRGWCLLVLRLLVLRRRLLVLLLLQVAEACVLVRIRRCLIRLTVGHALPRHVRTAAHHGCTQQRTSSKHRYLLR